MLIETKITIKHAKLSDGKLQIGYEEAIDNGVIKHDVKLPFDVHPDLIDIYNNLAEHGARIAEQIDYKEPFGQHVNSFNCSQVSLSGEDEGLGVVLTMQRTLKCGLVLCYNTPRLLLNEQDVYPKQFMGMLLDDLTIWRKEVKLAIVENKQAPDPQGDLFTDN